MGIQVFEATHIKEGEEYSPSLFGRQFISFSYSGKYIEDFGLIAVFNNDRLTKDAYAPFSDTTTSQTEIDGQLFWQSKYNANQLSFTLATDGMTSRQYEDFKAWFVPGVARELILAEHSNRAIMARISAAPALSVVPFEDNIELTIGEEKYASKTTNYKGQITLSFVMDEPFWYAINDHFDGISEESVKILYEDNIPLTDCFPDDFSCFLANNKSLNNKKVSENTGLSLGNQGDKYLYYCGTAPEIPIINFSITGTISDTNPGILSFVTDDTFSSNYFGFQIGPNILYFTYPEIINSFNRAQEIADKYSVGQSYLDLRAELRDNIYDYYVRAHAMYLIDNAGKEDYIDVTTGAIKENFKSYFKDGMLHLLNLEVPFSFSINGKTGEVTVTTTLQINETTSQTITENAGNMIKSKHLIIEPIENLNLWNSGAIGDTTCHAVKTNVTSMEKVTINYKYRYL